MKKYLVLLFATLWYHRFHLLTEVMLTKINLVKKLYKTDKHGYENWGTLF